MTRFVITIDVEECFDVTWVLDALKTRGLAGTFFLDVFASSGEAGTSVGDAARQLVESGMDTQLHTHVEHLGMAKGMSGLDAAAQREVIAGGAGRLREWTGVTPTWHRAGDLQASKATLAACREEGIRGDTSFIYGWPQCAWLGVPREQRNNLQWIDGVLELPVTTFLTLPFSRSFRHYDLDVCTLAELTAVARKAVEAGQDTLVMLVHSTSFFSFRDGRFLADERKRAKTTRLLDAVCGMEGLDVSNLSRITGPEAAGGTASGNDDLCAGVALTYGRAWAHFDRSAKHKAFALAPILLCAAVAAIVWLVSAAKRWTS